VDRRRASTRLDIEQNEPEAYRGNWDKSVNKLAAELDWLESPTSVPAGGMNCLYHDYWRSLEADVHNLRSVKTEASQAQLHRLGRMLRSRRAGSVRELVLQAQKAYHEANRR